MTESSSSSSALLNSSNSNQVFSSSDANNILEIWREFDLDGKRLTLDKNCVEMKELKTASITGRKRLNDATKSFRSKSKDDQITMMPEVLKAYQEEIDQLSRRSKFSEASFYSLYKSLYEAPDPCCALEFLINGASSSSVHQLEIERLRSELSQYEEEFQQLKNQDITIRRLEDQLTEFREQIEEKILEEVNLRSAQIEEHANTKVTDMKDLLKSHEKRLNAAMEAMRLAQASAENAQSQLYDVSAQAEVRINALLPENSMLADSAKRSAARVNELENEVESLKMNISNLQQFISSNGNSINSSNHANVNKNVNNNLSNNEYENEESQALKILLSDLKVELAKKDELSRQERQKADSALREVQSGLMRERDVVNALKKELSERPTREALVAVRRQLKTLQVVAFNSSQDNDDDEAGNDPENTLGGGEVQLEILLTSRLKQLENELTETRRDLDEVREQERQAKSAVSSLRSSLESSAVLIARLESDLEAQTKNNNISSTNKSRTPLFHLSINNNNSNTISSEDLLVHEENSGNDYGLTEVILGGNSANIDTVEVHGTVSSTVSSSTQDGIVSILQAQRDRYKEKLTVVETRMLGLQQQLESFGNSKAQLEADNLALYSKMRFVMQSCSTGGGASRNYQATKGMKINPKGRDMYAYGNGYDEESRIGDEDEEAGNVEKRYRNLYEQHISPFAEFSQHEKLRKLEELSVSDRIVLNTTMAFVSSHNGRSFLLIYLLAMHLLVFLTLYYSAHHVHYGCDPSIDHLHAAAAGSAALLKGT